MRESDIEEYERQFWQMLELQEQEKDIYAEEQPFLEEEEIINN